VENGSTLCDHIQSFNFWNLSRGFLNLRRYRSLPNVRLRVRELVLQTTTKDLEDRRTSNQRYM
jgi:hypothetical protein